MTSVNAPRDDEGVLRLKLHHHAGGLNPGPDQVQPYAVVRRSMDRTRPDTPLTDRRRRDTERRQGERRQRIDPVMLDTRSHRERRSHLRRRTDRANGLMRPSTSRQPEHNPAVRLGVDYYV